ncbi:speedy protein C isoform X4 [Monodelphis domestica]|uniref:speedy protein C isoform X4 n=2 Tax=Monodelphis domestica TaxID=13616 RepID=UPI0024E2592C|nr:speedy protein C isoform X4 [Monodelphis domestica]
MDRSCRPFPILPPLPPSTMTSLSSRGQDSSAALPAVTSWVKPGVWAGTGHLPSRQCQEVRAFLNLLEDSYLQQFFATDLCFQISDKYLLAMALIYFQRAGLQLSEYTHSNLFLALYLANDMEEDREDPKYEILPWALGQGWRKLVPSFLRQRDQLWARMGYRAAVSRHCCEEVMAKEPSHWAWTRERPIHHGGAQRSSLQGNQNCPSVMSHVSNLSPLGCSVCGCWVRWGHSPFPPKEPSPKQNSLKQCPPPPQSPKQPLPTQSLPTISLAPWPRNLFLILPPMLRLEPGTYTLQIMPELATAVSPGSWQSVG